MTKYINEHARRWLDALRSGDYKQGKGRLCVVLPDEEPCFCTLGVAADLFVPKEHQHDNHGVRYFEGGSAGLSREVADKIGLQSILGAAAGHQLPAIFELNDTDHWSFTQIADHLEHHSSAYFVPVTA